MAQTAVDDRTLAMLRALASPIRYRIATLLAERKDCTAGQLQAELQVSQSSLFEHLGQLRDAGIVQTSGGNARAHRYYCLNPDAVRFLRAVLGELSQESSVWLVDNEETGAIVIRNACADDAGAIAAIYNQGIEDRVATLETQPRTAAERASWMASRGPRHPVLVAVDEAGAVVGWGSLNSYNPRPAYDHVAEFSVYVGREQRGRGIGDRLLGVLEERARALGYHKMVLAAFPTNAPGMRLYQRHGFVTVGIFREQGRLDDRWVDVIVMEKILA
jgi:L-amino acid N-acyltransferase YncA/DNA-binding transcriptional ArsR family regulator